MYFVIHYKQVLEFEPAISTPIGCILDLLTTAIFTDNLH